MAVNVSTEIVIARPRDVVAENCGANRSYAKGNLCGHPAADQVLGLLLGSVSYEDRGGRRRHEDAGLARNCNRLLAHRSTSSISNDTTSAND
jgi:hypothetical protein